MLVAQNSLGPVCPVPLTVRGSSRYLASSQSVNDPRNGGGGSLSSSLSWPNVASTASCKSLASRTRRSCAGKRARAAGFAVIPLGGWAIARAAVSSAAIAGGVADGVVLGSGGPGLLYLYKHVCRPPGGRGGAREGYVGRSGGLGSSMGSIWATACLRTYHSGRSMYKVGFGRGEVPQPSLVLNDSF